ncbi:MAG: UvrD-helicase domain-containing protein [Lysobacterales bacterium]
MSLNPAQRAAVQYTDGPLLVLAGAGSGKTRVIIDKIAHLAKGGLAPHKITAITFTNRAAREMRERAAKALRLPRSDDADRQPTISTFHALGLKFLHIECAKVGLRSGFSVFGADDSLALMRELVPPSTRPDALEALRSLVGRAKNDGLAPDEAEAAAQSAREREAATLYTAYQRRLGAFNAVDFDDLIRLPMRLLEDHAGTATAWRERIRYLLVDEYQDSNRAQYRLLKALAGPRGAFTAVGDDDQSIYAWRGAAPENLDELAHDFPALKTIKLEQNYRCSGRILRAANALIAHNPHKLAKTLWSEHPDGSPIRVLVCADVDIEAARVAGEIWQRGNASGGLPLWQECAVLYRGNHQSRVLEKALRAVGVPYHLSGGQSFFERTEVRDLLAWLRLIANPDDDVAFLRAVAAPRRDVGAQTLERLGLVAGSAHCSLARAAAQAALVKPLGARPAAALTGFTEALKGLRDVVASHGVAALAAQLAERTGYRAALAHSSDVVLCTRRIANVDEFVAWLTMQATRAGGSGLAQLNAQLALLDYGERDDPGNQVRLMTLHGAKGLEFRHVWLIGVEDGVLPHDAAIDAGTLEEERRLFYVGMTRARESLTLSHAQYRSRFGERNRTRQSRFLDELPAAELRREGDDPEQDATEQRERNRDQFARLAALLG